MQERGVFRYYCGTGAQRCQELSWGRFCLQTNKKKLRVFTRSRKEEENELKSNSALRFL